MLLPLRIVSEMILMRGHNLDINGEMSMIIPLYYISDRNFEGNILFRQENNSFGTF